MIYGKNINLAVLLALGFAGNWAARANPIHYPDTISHPDSRSWTDAQGHHQHRSTHTLMNWGDGDGKYDANKVWMNEKLTFFGDTTHGSHGFMEEIPVSSPDFYFAGDWTLGDGAKAKDLVTQAFSIWSSIRSDRSDLIMGLLFNLTTDQSGAEIRVHWALDSEFATLRNAIAFFDPGPIGVGSEAYYNLVFDRSHSWYFDGDKAGFLASSKADDFFTVALHETGHVVGLQHQTDKDDVMETFGGAKDAVEAGGAFRALGNDDIDGARDLYSVSTPEPASVLLMSSGLAFALVLAKKRAA